VVVVVSEEMRVDLAAQRYLGTERNGAVEALLTLNPGLASCGGFVPEGFRLVVPPRDEAGPKLVRSVNPWE
jgi:phage tail protein X